METPVRPGSSLRVVLADDHEVVRRGLRTVLELEGDISVVGEGGSAAEALDAVETARPDIVVLDVRMPGGGLSACRAISDAHPSVGVIMLTSFSDDEILRDSIEAGAAAFVLKQVRAHDLVGAIRRVGAGESMQDPQVKLAVLERLRKASSRHRDPKLALLTAQEERILEQVGTGLTNREIARRFDLSDKTVKNYLSTILRKLGVSRRAEAASYLVRARAEEKLRSASGDVCTPWAVPAGTGHSKVPGRPLRPAPPSGAVRP